MLRSTEKEICEGRGVPDSVPIRVRGLQRPYHSTCKIYRTVLRRIPTKIELEAIDLQLSSDCASDWLKHGWVPLHGPFHTNFRIESLSEARRFQSYFGVDGP